MSIGTEVTDNAAIELTHCLGPIGSGYGRLRADRWKIGAAGFPRGLDRQSGWFAVE
jgi:hypothetical protein